MVNEDVTTHKSSDRENSANAARVDRATRIVEPRGQGAGGGAGLLISLLIIAAVGLGVLYLMTVDSKEAAQTRAMQEAASQEMAHNDSESEEAAR